VSRILLLLIFVLWMAAPQYAQRPAHDAWIGVAVFLGYYLLLVLVMGVWGRLLARRVSAGNLRRNLRRFNYTLLVARAMIPVWFAFGVFWLGWGEVVHRAMGFEALRAAQLPGLLLATLPPMAAWMGLWWSQYPAEIALREQSLLGALEADLPIHAPPPFRDYFLSNVRLRLLFTVVPIFLIVMMRDVLLLAAHSARLPMAEETLDGIAMAVSAGTVFLLAPEILRRVLDTVPLEHGPLRRKLEAMCRRSHMRYRDILVWRTHSNMGNAAVMGIVPQVRYVLLSDLLLETMTDEQIEAVFAHEMGHVVHRHMAWFVLFFATVMVAMQGALSWILKAGMGREMPDWTQPLLVSGAFFWVLLLFGYLSRRFERQADVFAARTMEQQHAARAAAMAVPLLAAHGVAAVAGGDEDDDDGGRDGGGDGVSPTAAAAATLPPPGRFHVGTYGATLFASALQRVAVINNMPTGRQARWGRTLRQRVGFVIEWAGDLAHNWLHGGIQDRQDYLKRISTDPAMTHRFDRFMFHLYSALLFLLAASIAFYWSV
jgi:STE24 endopeptidase